MPNSSKRSSGRLSNPPFVPSPRWLSESPAFQGVAATPPNHPNPDHAPTTPRVDYPGDAGPQTTPPISHLRSPIPPPPSNLFQGNATAFNVDPGVPFLATAGGSSDGGGGRSQAGSPDKEKATPTSDRRFVGGIVTGLKKVVRRSLRERPPRPKAGQSEPPLRDSGYEPEYGNDNQSYTSHASSRKSSRSASIPSVTLVGHMQEGYDTEEDYKKAQMQYIPEDYERYGYGEFPVPEAAMHYAQQQVPVEQQQQHQQLVSPEILRSPISADVAYGPDYARMDPPTPPPSNASIGTYLKRVQHFVETVNNLPWVGKERVTVDYFPEKKQRKLEPKRHPAIVWRSEDTKRAWQKEHLTNFNPPNQEYAGSGYFSSGWSITSEPIPHGMHEPRRASRSALNLDEELEGSRTPLPGGPASLPQNVQPGQAFPQPGAVPVVFPPGSVLLQTMPQPEPLPQFPPLPVYPPLPLYPPQQQQQQPQQQQQFPEPQQQPQPQPQPIYENKPPPAKNSMQGTPRPQFQAQTPFQARPSPLPLSQPELQHQPQPQPRHQPPSQPRASRTPSAVSSWDSPPASPPGRNPKSPGRTPYIAPVAPSSSWTPAPSVHSHRSHRSNRSNNPYPPNHENPALNPAEAAGRTPSLTPQSILQLQAQLWEEEGEREDAARLVLQQDQQDQDRQEAEREQLREYAAGRGRSRPPSNYAPSPSRSRASSRYSVDETVVDHGAAQRQQQQQQQHSKHKDELGGQLSRESSVHIRLNSEMPRHLPGYHTPSLSPHSRSPHSPHTPNSQQHGHGHGHVKQQHHQLRSTNWTMPGYVPAHRAEQYYGGPQYASGVRYGGNAEGAPMSSSSRTSSSS
ncbi:hypothetical protein CPC08DRAFT_724122 [Agrocybe pediades]|nr:hypothetical protein CPC08DRAFT_724122 [Agrocybe pediades]